ncbi:hypothetical protein CC85DRAFT_308811 [Cutaneotrichosporon oleaginosum]|uniref:RanBD1 domain-containing protein n=1 Tax=Cutaneotrichosporon oleaginosum TaxID=879819 RepID=A0A0J1AZN1_9TREE|nr:uncharacterized protein CC85DRAFT_308811 [Cutaneotrichosporon oleaginosum]KLT40794.1 hypothetical protein CC85DRAFT_308811 [Cutaneotrichosporon oleaginosum]TXT11894.1 hypothetical protein COLE_02304 [Cutaneotrichosporon oleaginosum]
MADTEPKPAAAEEHDPHFEPVVRLTETVEIKTGEDEEDAVFKMRAKLFRFNKTESEWKERGTGEVRLLKHKVTGKTRVLMRRDKTLKVCANHTISADMKLAPNVGSDRSWVWNATADVSDGAPSADLLAIRFANPENANLFKKAFEEAQEANQAVEDKEEDAEEKKEEAKDEKPAEEAKAEEPKADAKDESKAE